MLDHLHSRRKFSRKTLITLSLNENEIGDDGAKHLADALKINEVRLQDAPVSASPLRLFSADARHIESLRKSNKKCCRGRGSGQHTRDQSGLIISIPLCLLITAWSFDRH